MMSVAPVASAGTAAGYYSNADNYYFLGSLQSLWIGEGARELGLEGNVRGDDLTAVLEGRLPDGSRLGKEMNGIHVHRPGHDLTFSAPKSVSILALIGGDKDMLEAHDHAVRVAAGYVEKLISARDTKDGVTSIIQTGKMVAAAYTHDTSRNLDPQLHTHLLIANMTELNGKWKALATDYIHDAGFIETVMKMQVTLGKIYRGALRERVEALGHDVETVGKHGMWEIKGVPEDVREEYSSRGREIQGAIGAEATLRSRDVAAKDTRRAKVDPSRLRLMERWQTQMKEKGFDLKGYMESVSPREDRETRYPEPVPPAPVEKNGPGITRENENIPEVAARPERAPDTPAAPRSDREVPEPSPAMPGDHNRHDLTPSHDKQPEPAPRSVPEPRTPVADKPAPALRQEVLDAVKMAVSQLSDSKTRFTWGELMLTTTEFSDKLPDMKEVKQAIDASLKEGLIIPLDSEKGVFTSRIHLLDELSIQALSQEHIRAGSVVSFTRPELYAPASLEVVEQDSLVLMNAPGGVAGIRGLTSQIAGIAIGHGREVSVLASSAERATSLAKDETLRERLISRQHVVSGEFSLKPQSTLIIEGAERLGLKETLVLLGEARVKDAQLVFLDSAGRQANGNAMSVLESAGVPRSRRTEPSPGLETDVVSIPDKRNRYEALANRFAELSAGSEPVTAVVIGQREQKQLTGLIRDALQNAGQLERDGVTVEARSPVWLDGKTRRMPGSYRSGQVLEDRSDARETRHYVIDRVHEDTRMLSLIDGDGVVVRQKISSLTADWRLYNSENISVAEGEKLLAVAGDKAAGLKAKDRLQVTGVSDRGIEVVRDGKPLVLPADRPLYITHGYVAAPGGRDNDNGTVLAALNSRDITARTMNSLAQSGQRAEVFTAEAQDRAEARLQRMTDLSSPVQLVRRLSGQEDVSQAVGTLQQGVKSDAALAVHRAIADQRSVVFSELKLVEAAQGFHPDMVAVGREVSAMVKNGDLITVPNRGEPLLVSRATWEMEKAILRTIEAGKDTQEPLMEQVDPKLLNGLTSGQKQSAMLVLGSRDQFTGIQGYAGVGKTTQVGAVKAAIETLPADVRPELRGLAPTHQAVKELKDVGMVAQTAKSFIVEHDQLVAAGQKPDYRNQVFLIDESSMLGNQDTAAAYQAIQAGGGRAVSMGDIDQFESVDAGAPFKLMQERSPMDVAIMKQIVRQKDSNLKDAVHDIIDNRIDAALRRIESQPTDKVDRISDAPVPPSGLTETGDPVNDIVADWAGRTPAARARTIIITQLNKDRQAVNQGIYHSLAKEGSLGREEVTVPVLEKISRTRHEFNKTAPWQKGMVVKRGERYQDVIAVDRNGSLITVRDENGDLGMYSPRELLTNDVQLFTRAKIPVRTGTELRFTATDREQGQTANQRYTVDTIRENGEMVLRGAAGTKVINPNEVRAEQHIDYAWAVTGYGAQGASSDYVISLEGTDGGRRNLATQRAFYISTSRAKEHVQIYTDGREKWIQRVKSGEYEDKTAHDALKPETERKQAKAIWAMGQPVSKTAIGRAWSRHQDMGSSNLTARIIPATRRFPEPSLALPLYDNNGKSAGLALVSLVASNEGRLTQGDVRMVATQGARAAVLQRSQTGHTHVVKDMAEALRVARDHPRDGVVWQTSEQDVSGQLMKITKGTDQLAEQRRAQSIIQEVPEIRLPADVQKDAENAVAQKAQEALQQEREREQTDASRIIRDALSLPDAARSREEGLNAAAETVSRGMADRTPENIRLPDDPEITRNQSELQRARQVQQDLSTQQENIRLPDTGERGRAIERDEPTPVQHIQKER
ncbi:conjugative transfer relaxase/helicase TraI [Siccibacter turicensis]|uniref:conjugative transfer relaxase/helicase TraI n=1 Tax=Siccibacter TaxID=1649298 RepID=UPI000463C4AD|nr:conjugative transfer relaxase/helicase TraI [Siccibacter turicensis]